MEEDLRTFIRNEIKDKLKLRIISSIQELISSQESGKDASAENTKTRHKLVRCNICGVSPIIGIRYKCFVCKNYDLCFECEQDYGHNHPLLKIRHPE